MSHPVIRFQALALDDDGTLASHDHLTDPTIVALERARRAGLQLILVTGRTATLIQTAKIQNFPLVLVGHDFWRPLTDFLHVPLERMGLIDPRDADRIIVADSAAEAVGAVRDIAIPGFGLRYRVPGRRWLLNE